jgi:uncharacterized protein YjcR
LREAGYLTRDEIAEQLGVCPSTVSVWRRHGWLESVAYNDKGEHLYPPPGPDVPVKHKWKNRAKGKLVTHSTEGAQYEA